MTNPNRERKNNIKFITKLNEEQLIAKELISNNPITIITGESGSGKSLVVAQVGLEYLTTKQIKKLYVTRPTVEVGTSLGFTPGDLKEKLSPYLEAFIDNLYKCLPEEIINKYLQEDKICGCTIQHIRGKTFSDILVVEEAQNLTVPQAQAIITRVGLTGKIIINGDLDQKDIKVDSGLAYLIWLAENLSEIKHITLLQNHRNPLVKELNILYKKYCETNKIKL